MLATLPTSSNLSALFKYLIALPTPSISVILPDNRERPISPAKLPHCEACSSVISLPNIPAIPLEAKYPGASTISPKNFKLPSCVLSITLPKLVALSISSGLNIEPIVYAPDLTPSTNALLPIPKVSLTCAIVKSFNLL